MVGAISARHDERNVPEFLKVERFTIWTFTKNSKTRPVHHPAAEALILAVIVGHAATFLIDVFQYCDAGIAVALRSIHLPVMK